MKKKRIFSVVVIVLLLVSALPMLMNTATAQSGDVYPTDSEGTRQSWFRRGDHNIYFTLSLNDVSNQDVTVELQDWQGTPQDSRTVTVDDGGFYSSSDNNVFFGTTGRNTGKYFLNVTNPVGDYNNATVHIYSSTNYQQNSWIKPTDVDHNEKKFFTKGENVYSQAKLIDQHGNAAPAGIWTDMRVNYSGEPVSWDYNEWTDQNGVVNGSFGDFWETGQYELIIEHDANETTIATNTFTVIYMEINIYPDQTFYTQGQDIEISVQSNYPEPVDISINSYYDFNTGPAIKTWSNQSVEGAWSKEYTLPTDLSDGRYIVLVNESDTDHNIDDEDFMVKKYELDATTDKDAYLPDETVHVYYTVSKIVDGSEATGMDVEYRVKYWDDNGDQQTLSSSVSGGSFNYEVPSDIRMAWDMKIDIWANKSDQYETHWGEWREVSDLSASFSTDSTSYLTGQTVYVDVYTHVDGAPVENADFTVRLKQDGDMIDGYEFSGQTDDTGQAVMPVELGPDVDPGLYQVNVTAEKNGYSAYPAQQQINVDDEVKNLNVLLDTDKYSYAPGEQVNVNYTVTQAGDVVSANVQYEVYSGNKVYYKDYASGGNIQFLVPDNFNPNEYLYLQVDAKLDQETTGSNLIQIPVTEMELLLNADQNEYVAGDNITFSYELVGSNYTDSIKYKIMDDNGDIMKMESPIGNEFTYQIPDNPASYYTAKLEVVTSSGVLLTESISVWETSEYNLHVEIVTESDYVTGVYKPGQKIKVRYEVEPLGDKKIPDKMTISCYFQETGDSKQIQTDSPKGTFTVNVPEGPDGDYIMSVSEYTTETSNTEVVEVEENPSALNMKTVGGLSLMSLLGLILLLLILGTGGYMLLKGGKQPTGAAAEPTEEPTTEWEEEKEWEGPAEEEETFEETGEEETFEETEETGEEEEVWTEEEEESSQIGPDEEW